MIKSHEQRWENMGKKKKDDLKQYEDITVASMNVEGMPWYIKEPEDRGSSGTSSANASDHNSSSGSGNKETLTPKETRHFIANAVIAALLVGGIFLFAIFLFLLFCVYIWF